MLPSAMESLTDPCLSDDWNAYGAYAGLEGDTCRSRAISEWMPSLISESTISMTKKNISIVFTEISNDNIQ